MKVYPRKKAESKNYLWFPSDVKLSKDFKADIVNVFQELKEIKQSIITMSHQIETINK